MVVMVEVEMGRPSVKKSLFFLKIHLQVKPCEKVQAVVLVALEVEMARQKRPNRYHIPHISIIK